MLPYQNLSTFCGIKTGSHSQFGIIGAPVDAATSFRSGAKFGPNAIRQASLMLTDGTHEIYDVNLSDHVIDFGNMPLASGNTLKMLEQVEEEMDKCSSSHMVTLGGDHSITLGILRSLYKQHGRMALLHLDAHCDTWDNHFGEKYGHGTWLYNAIEEGLIDPKFAASIGIRSPSDKDSKEFLKRNGGKTVSARSAMSDSNYTYGTVAKILKTSSMPVYLSLDIDSLDPAYAPGTGTPEIGGLSTMWVQSLMDYLYDVNFIGMDCVEVCPAYDHSEITSLAAATFVWQYMSMQVFKSTNI